MAKAQDFNLVSCEKNVINVRDWGRSEIRWRMVVTLADIFYPWSINLSKAVSNQQTLWGRVLLEKL